MNLCKMKYISYNYMSLWKILFKYHADNQKYLYLIAVAHEVMGGDEGLVDNHPARVLGSLDQQVGERWNGHVRLVGAVQQV